MTFQPVPWFVGGGAENPPEAARLLAHIATHGAAGVLLADDCEVLEAAVPSGNVRVTAGAVVVPNTKSNASGEVYLGRNPGDHTVAIAPTDASGPRSDLVYVRIADPQYGDEPAPATVADGPYISVEVAAGVSGSTKTVAQAIAQGVLPAGRVGVALARIDMPASTGTVTQGLIKDVRTMPAPRSKRSQYTAFPSGSDGVTASSYSEFPSGSASWSVDVPEWATQAIVHGVLVGVEYTVKDTSGNMRVSLGSVKGQACGYNVDATSNTERADLHAVDTLDIPKSMRGTTQTLSNEANRVAGTGNIEANNRTAVIYDIEFVERIT